MWGAIHPGRIAGFVPPPQGRLFRAAGNRYTPRPRRALGMEAGERVVLVHDWLTGMRGGEKCLEPLCRRWPGARLFTLLHRPGSVSPTIERTRICPGPLNRLPRVDRYYRYLLPLMPFAAGWRVTDADLVVSLSHAVAK